MMNRPDLARLRVAQCGDIIEFGTYPQTENADDASPIRWLVLENSRSELFVLSEFIIDCRRYHNEFAATTWRDSDLRNWLTTELCRVAFNPAERDVIKLTTCGDNGEGSPSTQDRLFLLSVAEVRALTGVHDDGASVRRRTVGTSFAQAAKPDGCRLYVYDKGVPADYLLVDGTLRGCSWWWTRTQLQITNGRSARAAFIGARSNVKSYGRVDIRHYGVRPAMKLDLQAPLSQTAHPSRRSGATS
jgi:hypothetical protein